ncbi:HlyD family efflux transporter periplasmic adaptor subunit [Achromobacter deleyi]|uniref:HlyD family efflux transporter periplasmic adaptor subunit n=1 Tax=Achromobacter deleyi TaxID=1353891 RepID=A0A7T4B7Q1_9BURK|nr:HlyD family efflux transporter periplasmic adaptor subunit [Achromobacter deleyi]QQB37195.1 HlyD family efflux transporter periplasmic adaptor subunit [Achromobacter deleyi]
MRGSAIARWHILVIACTLALCACSERDTADASTQRTESQGPRPVAVARGKVEVEGGLIVLAPTIAGSVIAMDAREGIRVERGQVLLKMESEQVSAAASLAKSELKLARAKLEASERRLPELRRAAGRYGEAARSGAASPQLADEAQQRLAEAKSDAAVARAESEVAETRLKQAEAAVTQLALRAPAEGFVVEVSTQVGSHLKPGDAALTLLPRRPLIVRAELNATYVTSVRPGMLATVASDQDPSANASPWPPARLVRINPIYRNGLQQQDTQRAPAPVVECILEFDGPIPALVGQNVIVKFHE